MLRQTMRISLIVLLLGSTVPAIGMDGGWYFTPAEIESAYRYQEHHGRRLQHPLKPSGCYAGQSDFVASFQGKEFSAPCRFITETKRHLKFILEQGAAKYLFPLDADHAHLTLPKELWVGKYSKLTGQEFLSQLLREPKLVALYHTAEHLAGADPKTGKESRLSKEWRAKRNVMGFFDGSPLKILAPRPDGSSQDGPEDYENVGTVHFLAHRLGELAMAANGRGIAFDLSFDEDFAVVAP